MEPARNRNSHATTATRRPRMSPSPVITDSSSPVFSRAAASSAAYSSVSSPYVGGVSHDDQEPSSRTRSIRAEADNRSRPFMGSSDHVAPPRRERAARGG